MMPNPRSVAPLVGLFSVAALAGCAADAGSADLDLSPRAEQGYTIARTNGCAACHGSNGEGGIGPELVGLFGSEVELDDGTTVVADTAYLTESIVDPTAKQVAGYRLAMPANNLDAAQVAAVVAYIEELGSAAP
jgi:cytochrome c oxidase subunit 2